MSCVGEHSSLCGWRRDGCKSASARPGWSAFNGLEGKAKRGEEKSYLQPLSRQNVVSGTFSLESMEQIPLFFSFPMTVFVVHELYLWDSEAAPAAIVLPQLDLFDVSQTKWRISAVKYKQRLSERRRDGGLIGRIFCRFTLGAGLSLPNRWNHPVALRMLRRMFLIFQRSLPTPLSSPECPPTPQINTLLGFSTQLLPS